MTFVLLVGVLFSEDALIVIPLVLAVEAAAIYVSTKKPNAKLVFLLTEVQWFALLMFLLLSRFEATMNVQNVSEAARWFVILGALAVELVFVLIIAFGDRVMGKVVRLSSAVTAIAVLMIVVFIFNEGLPAFQENSAFGFVLGSRWSPGYNANLTESMTLTVENVSHRFTIGFQSHLYYLADNESNNLTLRITNSGSASDDFSLGIGPLPDIQESLSRSNVSLGPGDSCSVNLTVRPGRLGEWSVSVLATSNATGQGQEAATTVKASSNALTLTPDVNEVRGTTEDYGVMRIPLNLTNTGRGEDEYRLTASAPDEFRPYLVGVPWNYTTNEAFVALSAGSSVELKLVPTFARQVVGRYVLNVTAVSLNDPRVQTTSTTFFTFENATVLFEASGKSGNLNQSGSVAFGFVIHSRNATSLSFHFTGLNPNLHFSILLDNTTMFTGTGSFQTLLSNETDHRLLLRLNAAGQVPASSDLMVSVTDSGTLPEFGIVSFIMGTAITAGLAILIAAPMGVGAAVYMAEYAPKRLAKILRPLHELLAGIPSVIFGLWGFLVFAPLLGATLIPFISSTFGSYVWFLNASDVTGRCILTASIVLAIMVVPIIVTLSLDSILAVKQELREGSLALGATRWQTVRKVVIPSAFSGIFTSVVLGLGRAIGETMAVLMIMGPATTVATSLLEPSGTMTSVIAGTLGWGMSDDRIRHALFAIGIVLFVLVFILNIVILKMKSRYTDEMKEQSAASRGVDTIIAPVKRLWGRFLAKVNGLFSPLARIRRGGQGENWRVSSRRRGIEERIGKTAVMACSLIILLFLAAIIGDIIVRGGLAINWDMLSQYESYGGTSGGILNAIIGSAALVGMAIAIATPLAILSAIYVVEYARERGAFSSFVMFCSNTLASTPSIIYGAFGFIFFVTFLGFRFSLMAGSLTLALMVIPLILMSTIEALKSVPKEYREASYALGADQWGTTRHVVLRASSPGIVSGVIISVGRAIGETAAVVFTAGYTALIVDSLFMPAASMPNMIYNYYDLSAKFPQLAEKVYAAAFVLIVIVLSLNIASRAISNSGGVARRLRAFIGGKKGEQRSVAEEALTGENSAVR